MGNTVMMQGCELLDFDREPQRGVLEICDGRYWDGEPARWPDGTPARNGYYYIEVAPDGHIVNNNLYGPYVTKMEAVRAAENSPTLTDFDKAVAQLERDGRIRRLDVFERQRKVKSLFTTVK